MVCNFSINKCLKRPSLYIISGIALETLLGVLVNICEKSDFKIFIDFNIVKKRSVTFRVTETYLVSIYDNRLKNLNINLAHLTANTLRFFKYAINESLNTTSKDNDALYVG